MSEGGFTRAIGLMSGTSMDGIDIALLDTDGHSLVRFGPTGCAPYNAADRALLRQALARAAAIGGREADGVLAQAERMITHRHAEAVEVFLLEHRIDRAGVDLVGFHGQTVLHRPKDRVTVQIGDGAALAAALRLPLVYDFRSADVAAGGEGAPLVPVFHRALVEAAGIAKPVAVLNLGGVANLTYIGEDGDPQACDTGPANALIDDLMLERAGLPFDRDGARAARGRVNEDALGRLLDHPFFAGSGPQSLDRDAFSKSPTDALSLEDAAATLTAFSAESVARRLRAFHPPARRVIACGGGVRNFTLMRELRARLDHPIESADAFGWSADAMEAQAFAFLAVRSALGLPITFPATTGAPRPLTGGVRIEP